MLNKAQLLDAQVKKLDAETQAAQRADREAKRQAGATSGRKSLVDDGGAVIDAINQALGGGQSYQELIDAAWRKNSAAVKDAASRAKAKLGELGTKLQQELAKLRDIGRQREHAEGQADLARKDFQALLKELQGVSQVVQTSKTTIGELREKFAALINAGEGDEAEEVEKEIGVEEKRLDTELGGVAAKWDQVAVAWEQIPRADVDAKREEEQTQKDVTDRLAAELADRQENAAKYIYQELNPAECPKQAR